MDFFLLFLGFVFWCKTVCPMAIIFKIYIGTDHDDDDDDDDEIIFIVCVEPGGL
jgi:hypothetical protein